MSQPYTDPNFLGDRIPQQCLSFYPQLVYRYKIVASLDSTATTFRVLKAATH